MGSMTVDEHEMRFAELIASEAAKSTCLALNLYAEDVMATVRMRADLRYLGVPIRRQAA